jgi:hypothetical protein
MGMGRPGLELGTYGAIRVYETAAGYRAMTRYRDYDGKVRLVERHGQTKGAAEKALRAALRDRVRIDGGAELQTDTRVSVLAEAWYESLDRRPRSVTTLAQYRDRPSRRESPQ